MKNSLLAGMLLIATGTANAALINIDFGGAEYTGQGILGDNVNTTWNSLGATSFNNLTYADGAVSIVDIATTFNDSSTNANRTDDLLRDRVIGTDGDPTSDSETITLSSLTANTAYDIVLYNGFFAQTYSIAGQSILATTNPGEFSANNSYGSWTEGVEYAVLASVMSDSLGELEITVTAYPDGDNIFGENSAIAGLQIQESSAVPLPAAAWLFVTGLLGLAGIARRKKT